MREKRPTACASPKYFVTLHPFSYATLAGHKRPVNCVIVEEAFATKKEHPSFKSGDTVTIAYRIKEGNKERIQQYRGVVIRISGHGDKKRFTVRKMSDNIGVERIFPLESPFIESIVVNKVGRVRRAKLYYLRALTGKKARIKEKRV